MMIKHPSTDDRVIRVRGVFRCASSKIALAGTLWHTMAVWEDKAIFYPDNRQPKRELHLCLNFGLGIIAVFVYMF